MIDSMLTKWSLFSRLETRTKECNVWASRRVCTPEGAMKVNEFLRKL
jgi:hypothetical protein